MVSTHPQHDKRQRGRRARAAPLAVACSLLVHVLAAAALSFSPLVRPPEEPYAEVEFAGREGVVIVEASFAAAALPEAVEPPRIEAPVEVTPQHARIEQRHYRQTPVQPGDFAGEPLVPSEHGEIPPSAVHAAAIAVEPDAAIAPKSATIRKAAAEPPAIAITPPSTASPAAQTSGFETPASFAGNAPPIYPAIAVSNRWSGSVLLKLWIDESGTVTEVRVERSSGYGVLDAAAVNAVRHWRGQPKRVAGKSVATIELQEIKFRLPE